VRFHLRVWRATAIQSSASTSIRQTRVDPQQDASGEEGMVDLMAEVAASDEFQ
jgi:hypothetical protein